MFVHHIAYRHTSGDIEEFVGSGLTPSSAHQNSVYCAKSAVVNIRRETFTTARIIDNLKTRAPKERSRINANVKTQSYLAALL